MRTLSWSRTLLIAVPLFVLGFIVTFFGYRHAMSVSGGDYDKYADLIELYWQFLSPNVAAMSAAVFLVGRKFDRVPAPVANALKDINICGFGIYCSHYAFIGAAYHWCIKPLGLPVVLQLPVTSFVAYMVVWAFVHGLRKLPVGKRIA